MHRLVQETAVTFEYEVPEVEEFADRIRRGRQDLPWLVCELTDKPPAIVMRPIFGNEPPLGGIANFPFICTRIFSVREWAARCFAV